MEYKNLTKITTGKNFTLREGGGEWLFTASGHMTKIGNGAELRKSYLSGDAKIFGYLEESAVYGTCELEGHGLDLRVGFGGLLIVRGDLVGALVEGTMILERGSFATDITVGEHGRLIVQRGAKVAELAVRGGGLLIKEP